MLSDWRETIARIESIKRAVRELERGRWETIGTLEVCHDGANRYRIRPLGTTGKGALAFGSTTVVTAVRVGHIGPANVQGLKLDLAAECRAGEAGENA